MSSGAGRSAERAGTRTGAGRTALAAPLMSVPAAVVAAWLTLPIDAALQATLPVLGAVAALVGAGLLLADARRSARSAAVRAADWVLGGLGAALSLAFGACALLMTATAADEEWGSLGHAVTGFSLAGALLALAALTLLYAAARRWWPGAPTR